MQEAKRHLCEAKLCIAEFDMEVVYLVHTNADISIRVRRRGQVGGGGYFYSHQKIYKETNRQTKSYKILNVIEKQITGREYVNFQSQMEGDSVPVQKTLLTLQYEGGVFELHCFKNVKVCIMEVRTETYEEKVTLPPYFHALLIQEVTALPEYDTQFFSKKVNQGYQNTNGRGE